MKIYLKQVFASAFVIMLSIILVFSCVTQTGIAYADSGDTVIGEISNVNISQNGIMTWDTVEGISEYTVVVDNQLSETAASVSFDLNAAIEEGIANGILKNTGNHKIHLETRNVSVYYTWDGVYKYYAGNNKVSTITRYYGATRYETSLKIADAFKQVLNVEEFDSIIISYGGNYADALAGSFLSKNANAPILIVDSSPDHMNAVRDYINNNVKEGGTVYLLGGEGVLPDSIKNSLDGYIFKRLGGLDRYETNLKILMEGENISPTYATRLIVCSGNGFADSLSAAATGEPIMLVNGRQLTDSQKSYLASLSNTRTLFITVVGGEGVVSKGLFAQLKDYGSVYRVGGKTRYETSELFAKHYYYNNVSSAVIASGSAFPDGLCGGPFARAIGAPLILVANGNTQSASSYIKDFCHVSYGAVLGGPTLISDSSAISIFDVDTDSLIMVS